MGSASKSINYPGDVPHIQHCALHPEQQIGIITFKGKTVKEVEKEVNQNIHSDLPAP